MSGCSTKTVSSEFNVEIDQMIPRDSNYMFIKSATRVLLSVWLFCRSRSTPLLMFVLFSVASNNPVWSCRFHFPLLSTWILPLGTPVFSSKSEYVSLSMRLNYRKCQAQLYICCFELFFQTFLIYNNPSKDEIHFWRFSTLKALIPQYKGGTCSLLPVIDFVSRSLRKKMCAAHKKTQDAKKPTEVSSRFGEWRSFWSEQLSLNWTDDRWASCWWTSTVFSGGVTLDQPKTKNLCSPSHEWGTSPLEMHLRCFCWQAELLWLGTYLLRCATDSRSDIFKLKVMVSSLDLSFRAVENPPVIVSPRWTRHLLSAGVWPPCRRPTSNSCSSCRSSFYLIEWECRWPSAILLRLY